MPDERSVKELLDELGDEPVAVRNRLAACEAITTALAHLGRILWMTGAIVGPDRKSGASPFKFGDDHAVGIATVIQIGGELGKGAIQLLQDGNEYAGSALIRQLVEVEYLAHAFVAESDKAADWLRADRKERLDFWSPGQLRKRSGDQFLASDYWEHCERGGHPTTAGMGLLPSHAGMGINYLWVDMTGHLASIWRNAEQLAEHLLQGPIADTLTLPDVASAIDEWRRTDGLHAALYDLARRLRGENGDGVPE